MSVSRHPPQGDVQTSPSTRHAVGGVNVVRRRDGSEVHLDDIATAEEGQRLLDEADATLLVLEGQLERDDRRNPDWRRRAEIAHKKTRRIRPALQRRIAELRRAEREAARAAGQEPVLTGAKSARLLRAELRRAAFINAAEKLLDRELFVEVWHHAAETEPAAFEGWEGVSP